MKDALQHFFELLVAMTERELKARYKTTAFGFVWLVANPFLQMLIIGFVFTFIIREPVEHYYFFLFIGLLVWNFFSTSLTKATPSIVYERSLIKKAKFPHAIIPLSIVFSNLIHFLLALVIFLVPLSFLGHLSGSSALPAALAVIFLTLFTTGLSLVSSALNVRYRDIAFFTQAFLIIWFYATPILYALTMIPRNILWLWRFNPMTSILQLLQKAFLGLPGPGPAMLTSNIGVIAVTLAVGILLFRRTSRFFDDWL
ncbi:ABC transporter permease [Candidatus Gottesmanbacteria bacterium]|nr:ABC transporter permease [Candidatus Gottesmanbacteria bacterium]